MQKAPVLVLNANFEPINICNVRRAIGMIITGKAAMVVNGRGFVRTITSFIPEPSVIRLEYMVHRPRQQVRLTRREVFRRDDFSCQYCGKHTSNLTIDHIVPKHLGGEHCWTNVVAACSGCNHRKGGRRLGESQMRLIRKPVEPPSNANYIFGHHLDENMDWEPYLSGW
jgi:5-methylcytosine-specific restriction endonuclease McrA